MNTTIRLSALALVALVGSAAAIRLALEDVEYRVDLHAVLEIWSDVFRDAENVPLTITRMSNADEMALGDKLHEQLWFTMDNDSASVHYISQIGQRLAKHIQREGIRYRFHVVEHPTVNAYALPGGHVYVTRGMLLLVGSEAELASVIGHEISHIDLRHCVQRFQYEGWAARVIGEDLAVLARVARSLFMVGFSEQQEIESDTRGMLMAAAANYDPAAAISLERKVLGIRSEAKRTRATTITGELAHVVVGALGEYFQTHPTGSRRIAALRAVYRRNAPTWRNSRFYVGKSNLRDFEALEAGAREDEWVTFREPHTLGPPPSPNPVATVIAPPRVGTTAEVVLKPNHHPINQWNVVARAVALRKEPRHDAPEVRHLELYQDVFVIARVGSSSWLEVSVRETGHRETGYLLEEALVRPVANPQSAQ